MLELKNVSVSLGGNRLSVPVSLVAGEGEAVSIIGPAGSGKSQLLLATLGLAPIASGYITIDGELVMPGSSGYFRQFVAYVPQRLPRGRMRLEELLGALGVKPGSGGAPCPLRSGDVKRLWEDLGIDGAWLARPLDDIAEATLRTLLLSVTPLLGRPIVLIDDMPANETAAATVTRLTGKGCTVVCTETAGVALETRKQL